MTLSPTRLWIPPRTHLEAVWRYIDDNGHTAWAVFTACPDRGAPFDRMLGTYLALAHDGRAERVTVRPDNNPEHILEVMPAWTISRGSP